jgi:hypothetical protein
MLKYKCIDRDITYSCMYLYGFFLLEQVESCFLIHNSSIHLCCTDSSLLMTHRGGLSLSIIIWRIGGGGAKFSFALRPKHSLGGPVYNNINDVDNEKNN